MDNFATTNQILHQNKQLDSENFMLKLDFQKAYDSIARSSFLKLWRIEALVVSGLPGLIHASATQSSQF